MTLVTSLLVLLLGVRPPFPRLKTFYLDINKTAHILLVPQGYSVRTTAYLIVSLGRIDSGSAVTRACFFVYASTGYDGSVAVSQVTPFDGQTYTISDYTYEGKTYKSIDIASGAYSRSDFHIYGVTNFETPYVVIS